MRTGRVTDAITALRRLPARSAWRLVTHSAAAPAVLASLAAFALAVLVATMSWFDTLRERAFDTMLAANLAPQAKAARETVVVDIDRAALERHGGWPWSREKLADLVDAIAAANPKAIGLDILFDGPDEQSPAAIARKLNRIVPDAAVARLAESLPDGDAKLAESMRKAPVVLGALLDPGHETADASLRPVLVRNAFDPSALWQESGIILPPDPLREAAGGIGIIAVPGDSDGSVRRIPLLVAGGGQLIPGLATELARASRAVPILTVDGRPRSLVIGPLRVPLPADGMLRLVPGNDAAWRSRTVAASDVLAKAPAAIEQLRGHIVLLGSSAPEVGGLRAASNGDLAPSVQLQADATVQLLSGLVPLRPARLPAIETVVLVFAIAAAALAGMKLPPVRGAASTAAMIALWIAGAIILLRTRHILVDPLLLPATAAATFTATAILAAANTLRREAAIRQRFEQHLAPAVVQQIVARPDALKLAGEIREITAFFTDVEGFTAMTDRAEPHQLIEVLDDYFDAMSRIVVGHGGLVDKIVGDAVHAIFNAPFDLAGHPRRAFDCALAIEAFSREFRERDLPKKLGFGITRIGFETGPAIVGDVGGSRKLDYTAHGNAMNAAARLEAANKDLATTIAIGPGAARQLPADLLRPLGLLTIRGRGEPQSVYTTWPADMPKTERERLRRAANLPTAEARRLLDDHIAANPGDAAAIRQRARLAS